jgi:2,4-dienoyl-CoA reductase-like NADH-dependent reductase (Old Yellow Enzyme family)
MLFVEATAVEAIGRTTPGRLGVFDEMSTRWAESLRRSEALPIALIQLVHAGRKASSEVRRGGQLIPLDRGGWRPVAPSALPITPEEALPEALDRDGMRRIREGFVHSTRRALRLGFDAIELHGAHGYLLHEFLSPIANRARTSTGDPARTTAPRPGVRGRASSAGGPLGVRIPPRLMEGG